MSMLDDLEIVILSRSSIKLEE